MTHLIIEDLGQNTDLDTSALANIRGGLTAAINNSQQANQVVTGGNGPVSAFNNPMSAASTILTESNPVTIVDLTTINLMNSAQNGLGIF